MSAFILSSFTVTYLLLLRFSSLPSLPSLILSFSSSCHILLILLAHLVLYSSSSPNLLVSLTSYLIISTSYNPLILSSLIFCHLPFLLQFPTPPLSSSFSHYFFPHHNYHPLPFLLPTSCHAPPCLSLILPLSYHPPPCLIRILFLPSSSSFSQPSLFLHSPPCLILFLSSPSLFSPPPSSSLSFLILILPHP